MSTLTDPKKLEIFNEFFQIEHNFTVNILPCATPESLSYEEFEKKIPLPFKMVNDISALDQGALKPLQAMNSLSNQLVDYLQHQNQKIDLLVNYLISQQDIVEYRHQGIKFGGGGLVFNSKNNYCVGDVIALSAFFNENQCAIYCFAEVIQIEKNEDDNQYLVIFHHIREEDRENLVRTSLHQQSKQLQEKAKQRKNAKH